MGRFFVLKVAFLLLGSGFCALIYQTVWLREFRLIFGASTAATAAVLAVFMGGLGFGGLWLGPRADRKNRPLAFYAQLEILIALFAAATPFLVLLIRQVYLSWGGTWALGSGWGAVLRLLLAVLILGVPAFLMGGTLPAAAGAVEDDEDAGRHRTALLYGVNTLGAVAGTLLSTFFLLEKFGNRATLWLACMVNLGIGLIALKLSSRNLTPETTERTEEKSSIQNPSSILHPPSSFFLLSAAAILGFVFMLMEMVWYRMLNPLLGGSTFTFGLILAVALLGIGLGGVAYALVLRSRSPSGSLCSLPRFFAWSCVLEAVCLAFPYVLGDRVALLALLLRPAGSFAFYQLVSGWAVVTGLVVLPAAFVAGAQFSMLIAMMGKGSEKVGRHTGLVYAWNTAGAIAGSLAGGFGFLPWLSAPGAWRFAIVLLVLLAIGSLTVSKIRNEKLKISRFSFFTRIGVPAIGVSLVVLLFFATGPTAFWRHAQIGAGRVREVQNTSNNLRRLVHLTRRTICWEAEGVESSIALHNGNALGFVVNGRGDGNTRVDAGTQVMSGLVGAILHPRPANALVIGLGTGTTAGWLADVPSMERVDVVELEPAILEVARRCSPVNRQAMANPKLKVWIGDGREAMLTLPRSYDLIVSAPSNPYRAGVAGLFSREYYRAASLRLRDGGLFLQWMQAYEIDHRAIATVYATLASVFPFVETWQTQMGDLLLVGTMRPIVYDASSLRPRLRQEPFKTALLQAWRVTDLEGFFSHYLANNFMTGDIAKSQVAAINTDDRNLLEFALARTLGDPAGFDSRELLEMSRARFQDRPRVTGGVDWAAMERQRVSMHTMDQAAFRQRPDATAEERLRATAHANYSAGDLKSTLNTWNSLQGQPVDLFEITMLAEAYADAGDEAALGFIGQLRLFQPVEADALLGRLRWRQGRLEEATTALEAAFTRYHDDPWPLPYLMDRALDTAQAVAGQDKSKALAMRLHQALNAPFAVSLLNERRLFTLVQIARTLPPDELNDHTLKALEMYEPHVPWVREFLELRARCYAKAEHPRAAAARHDLEKFDRAEKRGGR